MIKDNLNRADFIAIRQTEIGAAMIRILLCDDNLVFLNRMREKIRDDLKHNKIHCSIYAFGMPREIPEELLASSDIFFLDMDFSPKSETGLQLAKKIRQVNPKAVIIFLTNYIEYAPAGYKVQAFRYLLKNEMEESLEESLLDAITQLEQKKEFIQFSIFGESIAIYLEDILYIESQAHTAVVYLQREDEPANRKVKVNASITSLDQRLSERGFLRIQKSYLVNMRRIKRLRYDFVILDNGTELPMSEKGYEERKRKYMLWKGAEMDG